MGASKGKVSVTKMQFSEKLSQLRRKAGLSQEQLADRLGVTRQSVSKWESGTAVPELGKLIALSELFEVSVDYLVKDWVEEEAGANAERLEETVADLARYMKGYTYDSKTRVFGIPLVSIRLTRHGLFGRESVAKGIIAIGNAAVGVVALGAASVGAFSLGAFSVGVLSIGRVPGGSCGRCGCLWLCRCGSLRRRRCCSGRPDCSGRCSHGADSDWPGGYGAAHVVMGKRSGCRSGGTVS